MKIFVILLTILMSFPLSAEVILDGTLGPPLTLQGPNYPVTVELGQQQGTHLFHSFEQFNIDPGESVTFSGPDSIQNVISRVTGGHPSVINGLLRSTMPQAHFYFLNPYGILFGEQAKLDLPASFYASTADVLKLGTEGQFNARYPEQSILSMAPPTTFGFLTEAPATISLENSELLVVPHKTLSLIGGPLRFDGVLAETAGKFKTRLAAEQGRIHLASVAQRGEVTSTETGLQFSSGTAGGSMVANHSQIDTSGEGGGEIYIRAGRFELNGSAVQANTRGTISGKPIDLQVNELVITEGGWISSTTHSSGQGGDIRIQADQTIRLMGEDHRGLNSGIFANTRGQTPPAGQGGTITIKTNQLLIEGGAQITAASTGAGQGGNIYLQAEDRIDLIGESQKPSSIVTSAESRTELTGQGGRLELTAGHLTIKEGAGIYATTFGPGKGGDIKIRVRGNTVLEGEGQKLASGIFAVTQSQESPAGQGGTIELNTRQLSISNGARIIANTYGLGLGGNIAIHTDGELKLFGQGQKYLSIIAAESFGYPHQDCSISPQACQGGTIEMNVGQLSLAANTKISTSSSGQGQAGNLILNVGDWLRMQDATIETSAEIADGGNITLSSPGYLQLSKSQITTFVRKNDGQGGNIKLTPSFIVLKNSWISANAARGRGGNIDITATGLYNFSAEPLREVITASSLYNVDGTVDIHSPDVDVNQLLLGFSAHFLDIAGNLRPPCNRDANLAESHFHLIHFSGYPQSPENWSY